jgi:sulfur carrier protein
VIRVNGETEEFSDESVAQLLHRLFVDGRGIAVAMNGEVVPRSQWDHARIDDGATIEIVTAVAGG